VRTSKTDPLSNHALGEGLPTPPQKNISTWVNAMSNVLMSWIRAGGLLAVVLACWQTADGQEAPEAVARFREVASEKFAIYWEAKRQQDAVATSSAAGDVPAVIRGVTDDALEEFAAEVRRAWPFALPETPNEAGGALVEAQAVTNAYFEGEQTRHAALAAWLNVSDAFPGTLEHDEALARARSLAMSVLGPEKSQDVAQMRELVARLAHRPGPPSGLTLRAEAAEIWIQDDLDGQIAAANRLLASLAERNSLEWLQANVLTPTSVETPESYVRRVSGYLIHFGEVRDDVARDTIELSRRRDELFALESRIAELQAAAAAIQNPLGLPATRTEENPPAAVAASTPPVEPDRLAAPPAEVAATAPPTASTAAAPPAASIPVASSPAGLPSPSARFASPGSPPVAAGFGPPLPGPAPQNFGPGQPLLGQNGAAAESRRDRPGLLGRLLGRRR
jgi:hypothetical protein